MHCDLRNLNKLLSSFHFFLDLIHPRATYFARRFLAIKVCHVESSSVDLLIRERKSQPNLQWDSPSITFYYHSIRTKQTQFKYGLAILAFDLVAQKKKCWPGWPLLLGEKKVDKNALKDHSFRLSLKFAFAPSFGDCFGAWVSDLCFSW